MLKQLVHGNWTVRPVGDLSEVPPALREGTTPARVPGCVHTDLLRAGNIPDPYQGRNEFDLRWIGHTDWQYRTTFVADENLFAHERIDLVFDGLDTVARIELNGSLVVETFNMHRGYRFDVRQQLKPGANDLVVTFASPVRYAERMREKLGPRPYCNGPAGPFNFIRKMACNFGWDWGPALPTSGIWRGVRVEGWSNIRLDNVRPEILKIDADGALVRVVVEFEAETVAEQVELHARILDAQSELVSELVQTRLLSEPGWSPLEIEQLLRVPHPKLWWPKVHGEQALYTLTIELGYVSLGTIVQPHWFPSTRIGLRTVELDTSPDDIGSKFVIKVNNKPIFCKGFNWIPDDCFLDRATEPARVRQRIQQAVDAGANMLRVWGGGIYETDEFYDICDEMGVLVWQDFLFACAMYPEEEPFRSEVEAEARYNVARLAHHPSLAIWNGCNENIWAYRDWGWKDQLTDPPTGKQRTWGLNYYLDLLPRICHELTPSVPYWAASPWSGDPDADHGIHPNADTHGNMHVWKPWFHEDYQSYRQFQARFCSEFGFQAPATYASIASVVPPDARDFGGVEMRHRQKSGDRVRDDGDRRNLRHLIAHFNLPGAQELYDSLEPPEKNRKLPDCGCEPLHAAPPSPPLQGPVRPNFDDLHYVLQVNQARALTLGVEWFRSRQPRCMGTLYWQLNDCWPGATSWSCIDGDGRAKPLWYATRKFFADVTWAFQPEPDGTLYLYCVNDTERPLSRAFSIERRDLAGRMLAEQGAHVTVAPRSVGRVRVAPEVHVPSDMTRELLTTEPALGATWFFLPDKELVYPAPQFDANWSHGRLTISAKSLLRDVCVFVDRLDPQATISEQLVTLLPGESFTFEVDSKLPLTREQLTSPPVFRCVNLFGAKAR